METYQNYLGHCCAFPMVLAGVLVVLQKQERIRHQYVVCVRMFGHSHHLYVCIYK